MNSELFHEKYPGTEIGSICVVTDKTYKDTGLKNEYGNPRMDYEEIVEASWRIELPHSCDEWVIGNVEEAKQFAKDLNAAIEYCEKHPIILT